jgi:hypothetical protein
MIAEVLPLFALRLFLAFFFHFIAVLVAIAVEEGFREFNTFSWII